MSQRWKIVFWGGDRCVRRHPAAIRPKVEKEKEEPKNSNLWPDVARFLSSISLPLSDEQEIFVQFLLLSPKNVFFRCAKGCSLTDTLPGKKKALPSRPVFPPIWQLHASTIIFDSSLRLYLFTSQHTQTSYAQHRLDRVVAELGYSKGPPSSIFDRFIIQSRHWFDLTIQSKVVQ